MKYMKSAITALCLVGAFSQTAHAKMSINDAQGCQAVLDFTIERLEAVSKYDKKNVKMVTKELRAYNSFLQSDYIEPGLADYTKGDKAAAKSFQKQIDTYKATLVQGLKSKHPQARIFSDQAVSISTCYKSAPMAESKLEGMTAAVRMIVTLAQQG